MRAVEKRVVSVDESQKLFKDHVEEEPPYELVVVLPFALSRMSCNEILAQFANDT